MANRPSPYYAEAQQAEATLLMQQENAYLKQRAVALNARVRELVAEVERLTPNDETPATEEEN